jgi:hypothetical protein
VFVVGFAAAFAHVLVPKTAVADCCTWEIA